MNQPESSVNEVSTALPEPGMTLAQIDEAHSATPEPETKKLLPTPDMFSKFLILEGLTHWFFRLGFASIFLVNAVYAAVDPASFTSLLEDNPIAKAIGHHDLMLKFAMVNDLLIAVFIIGGWRKRMVYAWAGAWLLLVAGLKLMNLVM